MPFCPNCGKEVSEEMEFCPKCGKQLTGVRGKLPAPSVSYAEALRHEEWKPKNWFERHLNWTMVLAWVGTYVIIFLVAFFMASADPYVSEEAVSAMGLIIGLLAPIPVAWWVLRKKNRSLAWLLLSWTVFFLLIGNKSDNQERNE